MAALLCKCYPSCDTCSIHMSKLRGARLPQGRCLQVGAGSHLEKVMGSPMSTLGIARSFGWTFVLTLEMAGLPPV